MTAGNWKPAVESLTPSDEGFFRSADFIVSATIDLPHSREQIWGALTDDRLGRGCPSSIAPAGSTYPAITLARRMTRPLRTVTINEEFHIWDRPRPLGFRAIELHPGVAKAWAELAGLEGLPSGGTRVTYTVAINSPILRLIPTPVLRPISALTPSSAQNRYHSARTQWTSSARQGALDDRPPKRRRQRPRVEH